MQPTASASLLPTSQALSSLRGLFAIPGTVPHRADEEIYLVPNFLHSEQWLGARDQQRGAFLENWEVWLHYRDRLKEDAAAAGRLSEDGHLARVPAKGSYVLLHPGQCHVLIIQFYNITSTTLHLVPKALIPTHLTL